MSLFKEFAWWKAMFILNSELKLSTCRTQQASEHQVQSKLSEHHEF